MGNPMLLNERHRTVSRWERHRQWQTKGVMTCPTSSTTRHWRHPFALVSTPLAYSSTHTHTDCAVSNVIISAQQCRPATGLSSLDSVYPAACYPTDVGTAIIGTRKEVGKIIPHLLLFFTCFFFLLVGTFFNLIIFLSFVWRLHLLELFFLLSVAMGKEKMLPLCCIYFQTWTSVPSSFMCVFVYSHRTETTVNQRPKEKDWI